MTVNTLKNNASQLTALDSFPMYIKETKEIVYRLLRHAVSNANKKIDHQLISQAIHILQKSEQDFNSQDLENLWNIYNHLSVLVAPATNESLWLKEHIERDDRSQAEGKSGYYSNTARAYKRTYNTFKWMGYFFGLLFFILQSYSSILSDSLDRVDGYYDKRAKIKEQIISAKQANPKLSLCESPLQELDAQYTGYILKLDRQYRNLESTSKLFLWGFFHPQTTLNYYLDKSPSCSTQKVVGDNLTAVLEPGIPLAQTEQNAESERSSFFHTAKSVLRVCDYLLLPTILGILGSIAYVIRGILDSIADSSLTFAMNRRGTVRIYLGGLLGLLSGVIFNPGLKELEELKVNYSPFIWAFLMGYSVEFAFSLFDALIEKGRNALSVLKQPPATASQKKPTDETMLPPN